MQPDLDSFNPQEISNMAWAFSAIGYDDKEFFTHLAVCASKHSDKYDESELLQLHHARLYCKHLLGFDLNFTADLQSRIKPMLQQMPKSQSSRLHQDVFRYLTQCWDASNMPFIVNEYFVEGYFIDIALPRSNIAIEVDGPTHHAVNPENNELTPLGDSVLKDKLLKAMGWQVLHVPYYHWDNLEGSSDKKSYLYKKLQQLNSKKSLGLYFSSSGFYPKYGSGDKELDTNKTQDVNKTACMA